MRNKKLFILIGLIGLMVVLSGCSSTQTPITANSDGFWDRYFVYPLSWVLTEVAQFFGAGGTGYGYGLSIVITTIVIRLILLPLMIQSTRSQKAMQAIQPEMQKLKEKYSSKDATTQQKLQQETMELFKKSGANPLAGCLPLIIQMPILLGFYQAIVRTAAIKQQEFLWFNLGHADPLYILPLVAGLTTFLQQRIMMGNMENPNPQMKIMMYIMPIMIIVFAINFPAALSLYWVVGNIFMMVQTYFISTPKKGDKALDRGAKK
ncbi:OxaA-like protein precursor [Fictibacillus macauensis ZFHKF-1]|uniref:Membrane protein insertase YidC n=1 Tax=Fictibacillus macauensis ZFHKF-1 TaxID=1196324 RepID=I8AKM6_9BACL|nr:YidC family membrane integrase SpoIIIJ [Fictibacillus macauensis]EIT86124.1 OxaA-like protein precursor [Fictibacillus macauensis ZFHKF-1]